MKQPINNRPTAEYLHRDRIQHLKPVINQICHNVEWASTLHAGQDFPAITAGADAQFGKHYVLLSVLLISIMSY